MSGVWFKDASTWQLAQWSESMSQSQCQRNAADLAANAERCAKVYAVFERIKAIVPMAASGEAGKVICTSLAEKVASGKITENEAFSRARHSAGSTGCG